MSYHVVPILVCPSLCNIDVGHMIPFASLVYIVIYKSMQAPTVKDTIQLFPSVGTISFFDDSVASLPFLVIVSVAPGVHELTIQI